MNHRPGPLGTSALSRTPSTMHRLPIFWMLPSAFSSMVVSPPAILPLVGGVCRTPRRPRQSALAWQCRSPRPVILRRLGGAADGFRVTVAFDAEKGHRLPRRGDAVGDTLRPAVLDADHYRRGDIGVGAGTD